MKINEHKNCFVEVRFEDLNPGDTFAEQIALPDDEEDNYYFRYKIKGWSSSETLLEDLFASFHSDKEIVDVHRGWAVDLHNGVLSYYDPGDLVIPIEINGDVMWPTKAIRRK